MFHTAAFFSAAFTNVANTDLPARTDDVLTISNSHFLMRENMQIVAAAAMSASMDRARIVLPSVRPITTPFIVPVQVAIQPANVPAIADWRDRPFLINSDEELAIEATGTNAMAEDATAAVWLRTMFRAAPPGPVYTLRGTSTTAAVADTWTTLAVTWQDVPKRGRYSIVGLTSYSTTGRLARLIIPGQEMRPGALSLAAQSSQNHPLFLNGGLGEWGQFAPPLLPQVQVLCGAADASHVVMLQFIPIG